MYQDQKNLRIRGWSVRSKLLTAYAIVTLATIIIATIGVRGFSSTLTALDQLQLDVIPKLSVSSNLSENSADLLMRSLALAKSTSQIELDDEKKRSTETLAALNASVNELTPDNGELAAVQIINLRSLIDNIQLKLQELIDLAQDKIAFRTTRSELESENSDQAGLISALFAYYGSKENVGRDLAEFEYVKALIRNVDIEEQAATTNASLEQYREIGERIHLFLENNKSDFAIEFKALLIRQSDIFQLTQDLAKTNEIITERLSEISKLIDQLSLFAQQRATDVSGQASAQANEITNVLTTSRGFILILSLMAIMASIAAMLYVSRDLAGNLIAVATSMSRLAKGDQTVTVPGENRADELGMLARAFRVFRDRSIENKSLSTQLHDKTRTLEAMFSNMTDGLSVFGAKGELLSWNPQFLQINELTEDEVRLSMGFEDLPIFSLRPDIKSRSLAGETLDLSNLQLLLNKEPMQFQQIYHSGKCVEIRSEPVPNGGFVISYTDLTDRKAMEQKLNQANRMEAIGKLTGGIAHDFNNMLAAITGNLQLLQEDLAKDPLMNARALRALDAAERGAAVTQRLLAFASQQSLEPESISINKLVEGLRELIAYGFDDRFKFETELAEGIPNAFVDPGQLESALLNLVFNSRDAMPDGGTLKIITAQHVVTDKEYVSVSVIDSGDGMDPDVLSHAYEPFFTTKSRSEGTGLGLSMVYGFAKQSGGLTAIESIEGQGTCIEILLPISEAVGLSNEEKFGADQGVVEEPVYASVPAESSKSYNLLLVEDDKTVRETAFDMIRSLGLSVTTASSYEEAQLSLNDQSFDFLFTDLMLPEGRTGIDVARHAVAVQPDIKVIFSSGYAKEDISKIISDWDGAVLIPKPYRKQRLAMTLHRQLKLKEVN